MEAHSEVLSCEGNLLALLTTDMMEKIAMSLLIRDSIFPYYYRGLSLRRTQPMTREAGIHLELVALGWVVNVMDRCALNPGQSAGACGVLQHVFMLDLFLTSLFAKRHKEQRAPF